MATYAYRHYYGRGYRYNSEGIETNGVVNGGGNTTTGQQSTIVTEVKNLYPVNVEDQLRTIYVGGVPDKLPEQLMLTALKHIPGLTMWLRFKLADDNDKLTNYGYARFSTAGQVKVALEVLPQVQLRGVNLEAKCEENTQQWLDSQGEITCQSVTRRPASEMKKIIQGTFTMWLESNPEVRETTQKDINVEEGDVKTLYEKSKQREPIPGVPAEDREAIFDEIEQFRQLSIKLEQSRLKEDFDYGSKEKVEGSTSFQDDDVEQEYVFSDEDDADMDDWELENQRQQARQTKQQRLFEDREHRWKIREHNRANAVARELHRASQFDDERERKRLRDLKRFKEWDDDDKQMQRTHIYYYDHPTWVKQRMEAREREQERDEADRQAERQEKKQIKPDSGPAAAPSVPEIPINFTTPAPPPIAKQRVEPPDSAQELFNWVVKWDKLTSSIIENKLRSAAINAMIEHIGIQEDELADMIMTHISSHLPAADLVKELSEPLDQDAEVLVAAVWRELIDQTENAA